MMTSVIIGLAAGTTLFVVVEVYRLIAKKEDDDQS